MSENVVPLRAAQAPVDDGVVAMLEELLIEATAGRIRGIAFTSLLDGAQIGSGWAGEAIDENVFCVLGALTALQLRFAADKALVEP